MNRTGKVNVEWMDGQIRVFDYSGTVNVEDTPLPHIVFRTPDGIVCVIPSAAVRFISVSQEK